MSKAALFVISAPSGAGKTTIITKVRKKFPHLLYSISCTTRPRRKGEIDGVHYYFKTKDEFQSMIHADEFLEWKEVHGNLYGTPVSPIITALQEHKSIILDIDVQGAREVFKKIPESVGIFVTAPNISILEQRLRARASDSELVIQLRLENAVKEIEQASMFSYKVVNDKLSVAVDEISQIIDMHSSCNPIQEIAR